MDQRVWLCGVDELRQVLGAMTQHIASEVRLIQAMKKYRKKNQYVLNFFSKVYCKLIHELSNKVRSGR